MTGQSDLLVFKQAALIDGTGAGPVNGASLVIEGELIKEVLEGPPGTLPPSAEVIDLNGRTLMPGLIDAHVHLICVEADLDRLMRASHASLLTIRALQSMRSALDQGFTSVRDCGGADAGFRLAVEGGWAVGPRLKVSGRHLSQTGGHGDPRWPAEVHPPLQSPAALNGLVVDGVDACRLAAREQLRQGVDFIKIMAGGGCMSPADKIEASQYSPAEIEAIVWEAESAGTYVAAHCYSDRSVDNCLAAGVRTIEHGNLISGATARRLAGAGACLVPTMAAYELGYAHGAELGIPAEFLGKVGLARERAAEAVGRASEAGCVIGSGSDLLGPMQSRMGLELTLQARVTGPMAAIASATSINAAILGVENETGSLTPGKLADAVVIDGDPLEDIPIIENWREKMPVVLRGGVFHRRRI